MDTQNDDLSASIFSNSWTDYQLVRSRSDPTGRGRGGTVTNDGNISLSQPPADTAVGTGVNVVGRNLKIVAIQIEDSTGMWMPRIALFNNITDSHTAVFLFVGVGTTWKDILYICRGIPLNLQYNTHSTITLDHKNSCIMVIKIYDKIPKTLKELEGSSKNSSIGGSQKSVFTNSMSFWLIKINN